MLRHSYTETNAYKCVYYINWPYCHANSNNTALFFTDLTNFATVTVVFVSGVVMCKIENEIDISLYGLTPHKCGVNPGFPASTFLHRN